VPNVKLPRLLKRLPCRAAREQARAEKRAAREAALEAEKAAREQARAERKAQREADRQSALEAKKAAKDQIVALLANVGMTVADLRRMLRQEAKTDAAAAAAMQGDADAATDNLTDTQEALM
jgi:hypothetical protein